KRSAQVVAERLLVMKRRRVPGREAERANPQVVPAERQHLLVVRARPRERADAADARPLLLQLHEQRVVAVPPFVLGVEREVEAQGSEWARAAFGAGSLSERPRRVECVRQQPEDAAVEDASAELNANAGAR